LLERWWEELLLLLEQGPQEVAHLGMALAACRPSQNFVPKLIFDTIHPILFTLLNTAMAAKIISTGL
jgi:hypothetical protein